METKRGRPPKTDDERADEVFQLRMTTAEKNEWRSAAESAGVSLSAWIRDRLNKAANAKR